MQKRFLKKLIPNSVWEFLRIKFSISRRFLLDFLQTFSYLKPVESIKVLFLVRKLRGGDYTMLRAPRLKKLYELAKKIDKTGVEGAVVECGVYNGGSAAMIMYGSPKRKIWLFDSFEGLPAPELVDIRNNIPAKKEYYKGWCKGSEEKALQILLEIPIRRSQIYIKKGWFNDSLSKTDPGLIAILHIDADWYKSTMLCLEKFYPLVSKGGFIILDDYGTWDGCRKATDDFIEKYDIKANLESVDGVGYYFQKI